MKRFFCILLLLLSLFMLISCEEVINSPSTDNCYNLRCEITMDNESFTINGENAKRIYSLCNEYMAKSTISQTAIGSEKTIVISVKGDKRENPKSDSDTVTFYTYTVHSNNVVEYSGAADYNYIYSDGFYSTLDTMIFFMK